MMDKKCDQVHRLSRMETMGVTNPMLSLVCCPLGPLVVLHQHREAGQVGNFKS